MNAEDDLEYFTRRHSQETRQARQSPETAARHAHKRLADLHRQRAGQALNAAIEKPKAEKPKAKRSDKD